MEMLVKVHRMKRWKTVGLNLGASRQATETSRRRTRRQSCNKSACIVLLIYVFLLPFLCFSQMSLSVFSFFLFACQEDVLFNNNERKRKTPTSSLIIEASQKARERHKVLIRSHKANAIPRCVCVPETVVTRGLGGHLFLSQVLYLCIKKDSVYQSLSFFPCPPESFPRRR